MAKATQVSKATEVVITRVFDAPRDLVWKAWTDPELMKQWWGPRHFTTPVMKMDLRVGGEYLNAMQGPDGKMYWSKGTYREVKAPERLVVTDSFADEKGHTVPASHYGMGPGWPIEAPVAITFEDAAGKTKLTLKYGGLERVTDKDRANMLQGWNESFDKLAESLAVWKSEVPANATRLIAEPGRQEFFIIREFDAPREQVFKAFVDPELYVQWLGPRRLTMRLEKFEPRSGGSWRYVHKGEDGSEYRFRGVFHEVLEPERLIDTFEYEGLPEKGHVSLETATFEELSGGRTRLRIHSVFQSVADRDGMIGSGMEQGVNEGFERLDELLKKMKK